MSARKGELTAADIDRGWPFQIALDGALCTGQQSVVQAEFCKGLSRCVRGHSLFHDDKTFVVQCFSLKEDAEKFMNRFGGEWFNPRERGRGNQWNKCS
ncbi:hypothetical protein [Pararhizobium sp. DWP3-4]|uniref:hypothetical protein n=1 Tax=Pararhizobium sp. DWP3-4 TaxID=2804565 RepID=UPI003CF85686